MVGSKIRVSLPLELRQEGLDLTLVVIEQNTREKKSNKKTLNTSTRGDDSCNPPLKNSMGAQKIGGGTNTTRHIRWPGHFSIDQPTKQPPL